MADDERQTLSWDDLTGVLVIADDPTAVGGLDVVPAASLPSSLPPSPEWVAAGRRDVPDRLWTTQNVGVLYRSTLQELSRQLATMRHRRTPTRD